MKIFKYLFCSVGLFVGIMFLAMGVFIFSTTKIDNIDRVETKGTIVSIDSRISKYNNEAYYDVFVQYDANGTTFVSELDSYSSNFYEGLEIDVCYDRNNPDIVMYEDIEKSFYIFPVIGIIIFSINLLIIIDEAIKSSRIKYIKRKGGVILAKYIGLKSLNGKLLRKQKIVCEWENPDDGRVYTFKSKTLYYYYLEDIISKNKIEYFEVRFLKKNPSKYIMNIDNIILGANNYIPDEINGNYYPNSNDIGNLKKDEFDIMKNNNVKNSISTESNLSDDDVIKYK